MVQGSSEVSGIPEARPIAASLYPAISLRAARLKAALKARTGAETAGAPALVNLRLSDGGQLRTEDAAAGPTAGGGVLDRFFKARHAPSREDWLRVVSDVDAGTTLRLAGGEPLVSPHLEAVLFEADRKGLDVEVATIGLHLEEHAAVVYGLGVARVRIVLFGPEEVHNRAVGSPSGFERAVRGALALRGLRYGTARPFITVDIVASAEDAGRLVELAQCALAMGADNVAVHYPKSGADGRGGLGPAPETMLADFGAIRRRWRDGVVVFSPDLAQGDVGRYCAEDYASLGPRKCRVPWQSIDVAADGAARFCGDEVIGDVKSQTLVEIYNGEPARAFRRLLRGGLLARCAGCRRRLGEEDLGL